MEASSTKRLAEQLPSSDNERIDAPPRKTPRSELAPRTRSFAEFLANALPTELADRDTKGHLIWASNLRLQQAQQENVDLTSITIGSDCLPTWPGCQWDPDEETLHAVIQRRLTDRQAVQDLGSLLRKDMMIKSNRKLNDAKALGIELEDVWIGKGLLPEWRYRVAGDQPTEAESEACESSFYDSSQEDSLTQSSAPTSLGIIDDVPQEPDPVTSSFYASSTFDADSDSGSDENSDCDSDEGNSGGEYLYTIHMNNFVSDQPEFEDPPSNILHDAQVVGGPRGFEDVDLEVYVVEDDDEVDDLPELELAVDREAFEYWFDTDDAIDVEFPGMEVQCTTNIEVEEGIEDAPIQTKKRRLPWKASRAIAALQRAKKTVRFQQDDAMDVDDAVNEEDDDDASDMSEEVTEDEDAPAQGINGVLTY